MFVIFWISSSVSADDCLPFRADEWTEVAYVHDGDSIKLKDGRSVRLIGVNAPEVERDSAPAEPLAQEARRTLMRLLPKHSRVALRFGAERRDKHGRWLAHVFTEAQQNVQEKLLEQGLAAAIAVTPNVANLECYLAAQARAGDKGIWRLPRFQGLETAKLPRSTRGFQVLTGRVVRVGESRNSLWLNFEGKVAARIDKRDLTFFPTLDPRRLDGETLKVRGWIYEYKGELQLRIQHQAMIEIVSR